MSKQPLSEVDQNRITDMHAYMKQAAYQWCCPESGGHPSWESLSAGDQKNFMKDVSSGKHNTVIKAKATQLVEAMQAKGSYQTVIAFGDSLTDQGRMNKRNLFGLIPMRGLAGLSQSRDGSFSDDLNWLGKLSTEYVLAKMVANSEESGIDLSEKAIETYVAGSNFDTLVTNEAGKKILRVSNRAEGGASSAPGTNVSALIVTTLAKERELFFSEVGSLGKFKKSKTLIFEMTGANDMVTVNSQVTDVNMDRALTARMEHVEAMYNAGYKKFMLGTLPDLSLTPEFQAKTVGEQEHAYRVMTRFNNKLKEGVDALRRDHPDLSIHIFDINKPFMAAYQKNQDDPNWRQERTDRTDLLDEQIQSSLDVTRDEYDALFDSGLIAAFVHDHKANPKADPKVVMKQFSALLNKCEEQRTQQFDGMDDMIKGRRNPADTVSPFNAAERQIKGKMKTQLRRQERAIRKVHDQIAQIQNPVERENKVLATVDLCCRRMTASFYNGLHPASGLYGDIEQDLMGKIQQSAVTDMDTEFVTSFDDNDTLRMQCLGKVRAEGAITDMQSVSHKTPELTRGVHRMQAALNSVVSNPKGEELVASSVFSAFMKDYAGVLKNQFTSMTQDSRSSRLGGSLAKTATASDQLTNVFYHALFNGGRRSRHVLQKLGYLTRPGCAIGADLLDGEKSVVWTAVRDAYVRAQKVAADPMGQGTSEQKVVKRRLRQLSAVNTHVKESKFQIRLKSARPSVFLEAKSLAKSAVKAESQISAVDDAKNPFDVAAAGGDKKPSDDAENSSDGSMSP